MDKTSEKLLEILNQICEKYGIVMDENIYSLSELAQNLTNEIVLHTLFANVILLVIFAIISIVLWKQYKTRHDDDNIIDRVKNIIDYYIPEYKVGSKKNSILYKKIEKTNSFKLGDYLLDTFIMLVILFVFVSFGIHSISYISEIIKCFVAPNMVVVDYFMNYYLN